MVKTCVDGKYGGEQGGRAAFSHPAQGARGFGVSIVRQSLFRRRKFNSLITALGMRCGGPVTACLSVSSIELGRRFFIYPLLHTLGITMSRAPSMRPIAAAVLPYSTANSLRCAAKPLAAQIFRQYATQPSRSKTMREMDRAARAGSSRMTKEQSISQLQKMANAEYFKDGGGPLFPGSYLLSDSSFSLCSSAEEMSHNSFYCGDYVQ